MLRRWREGVSSETAHFRELAGLRGTGHQHGLPIESHAGTIRDALKTKPICAVRSPPGSGKTMILPELLHEWAAEGPHRGCKRLPPAVMIVFPTQYGCLKIRDSLREFRRHAWGSVNLRTGVDKDDRFQWHRTKFQVVTYGMVWGGW